MKEMYDPPHPGLLAKRMLTNIPGLSMRDVAKKLHTTTRVLDNLFNGYISIYPSLAVRLALALNTSVDMWIRMQYLYDIYQSKILMEVFKEEVEVIDERN